MSNAKAGEVPLETTDVAGPEKAKVPSWAIHRRLYDWMLGFAQKRNAIRALFFFAFIESSFFPIPPDVLLGPLCLGNRKKAMWFATICTLGSVTGAYLGYFIGHSALHLVSMIPSVSPQKIADLSTKFNKYGDLYVFIAALTPIPFKLLTITAGASKLNLLKFGVACVVGRGIRFYAVAGIFYLVGPKAMPFIDKYFNLLSIIFTVLLIGGFLAIKLSHH
jgi:membrane protein YqaA with SNARE-associated domain